MLNYDCANTFAPYSVLMTPEQEYMLGREWAKMALREGQKKALPKTGNVANPEEAEQKRASVRKSVLDCLIIVRKPLTVSAISYRNNVNYNQNSRALRQLEMLGKVKRSYINGFEQWQLMNYDLPVKSEMCRPTIPTELFPHIRFEDSRYEITRKKGLIHTIHDPGTNLTRVLTRSEMGGLVRKYELRLKACEELNKGDPDTPMNPDMHVDFFLRFAGIVDATGTPLGAHIA